MSARSKKGRGRPPTLYDAEIDLHGRRADEVLEMIEKVLYRPEIRSILVIHGRGDGILKSVVRDFVRTNSYVREYHFGEDYNLPGADGVTVIYT